MYVDIADSYYNVYSWSGVAALTFFVYPFAIAASVYLLLSLRDDPTHFRLLSSAHPSADPAFRILIAVKTTVGIACGVAQLLESATYRSPIALKINVIAIEAAADVATGLVPLLAAHRAFAAALSPQDLARTLTPLRTTGAILFTSLHVCLLFRYFNNVIEFRNESYLEHPFGYTLVHHIRPDELYIAFIGDIGKMLTASSACVVAIVLMIINQPVVTRADVSLAVYAVLETVLLFSSQAFFWHVSFNPSHNNIGLHSVLVNKKLWTDFLLVLGGPLFLFVFARSLFVLPCKPAVRSEQVATTMSGGKQLSESGSNAGFDLINV